MHSILKIDSAILLIILLPQFSIYLLFKVNEASEPDAETLVEMIQKEPYLTAGFLEKKLCFELDVTQNIFLQVLLFQDVSAGRKRLMVSDGIHYMEHAVLHKDFANMIELYCVMKVSSFSVKESNGKTIFFIDSLTNVQPYSEKIGNPIPLPNSRKATVTVTKRNHGNNKYLVSSRCI